jgi:hypothetical protein
MPTPNFYLKIMIFSIFITLKNFSVVPPRTRPYLTLFCRLSCSTLSIGLFKRETVKKAAKLAV